MLDYIVLRLAAISDGCNVNSIIKHTVNVTIFNIIVNILLLLLRYTMHCHMDHG